MTPFERTFVISLPFRTDRIESFKFQCPIPEVTVWPAIHGDTCQPPEIWKAGAGAWGCYKSHLNILEHCLNNKISSYLVFEDDAQFRPEFLVELNSFMDNLPDDWEQIYLGGQLLHTNIHPPIKINEHVYRPYNVNRTHCFGVSRQGMLPLYQHISNLPFHSREHIDHHLGRWHEIPNTKVYCPPKWLVGQMGFTSNVSGKDEKIEFFTNPIEYAPKHWLYEKSVCIIYRGSHALLREAKEYLHTGNSIDANGYDVSLTLASKLKDPSPEIQKWYNWIRSEIVQGKTKQLPCLYHPRITSDMLPKSLGHIIEISPTTLKEITDLHKELSICLPN